MTQWKKKPNSTHEICLSWRNHVSTFELMPGALMELKWWQIIVFTITTSKFKLKKKKAGAYTYKLYINNFF